MQVGGLSAAIAEVLQAAQQALDAKPPPPEAVLTVYSQAKSLLDKARSDLAKDKALLEEVTAAPARHMALKAQLQAEASPLPTTSPARYSLAEVEQSHSAAKRTLGELTEARELADARSRNLDHRIGEIPDDISQAAQELAEARKRRDGPPPEDEPAGMAAAKDLLRKSEALRAATTLRLLESEREHAGAVGGAVRAELALAERRVDYAQKLERLWSEALKAKRREQGFELVRKSLQMQREFAGKDDVLRGLCDENVALAKDASGPIGVIARLRVAVEQQRQATSRLDEIQSDYNEIQSRLRLTGVTKGFGGLLIEHRDRLPLSESIKGQLAASRRELNEAQLRSLQLREESKKARKDGPALHSALEEMRVAPDTSKWRGARQDAQRILEQRRELLTEIAESYTKYQRALSETIAVQQELLKTIEEVNSFVEEKVLWTRNMPVLSAEDFHLFGQAVRALRWDRLWSDVAGDAHEDLRAHPISAGGALLAALALLASRLILRRRIRQLGRRVAEHPPGTFRDTLETLLWTVVSGAAWPVLFWVVAWRLTATAPNTTTTIRLAEGLNILAYLLLLVCLIREVCQPDGMAAAHVKRNRTRLAGLCRAMLLLTLLVLPLVYLSVVMDARPTDEGRKAVGRLASITGQLILSVLLFVLFRRGGAMVRGGEDKRKADLLYRSWWLWYPLAVALPLVLAGFAAVGYDYSAKEIGSRIYIMVSLVLGMRSVQAVVLRGIWLARRQMVRRAVQERREAEGEIDGEGDRELANDLLREAVGQVTSVSNQTGRFVSYLFRAVFLVVLYLMWEDLLPAFRFLSHTNLYAIGEVQVTLADPLWAILACVITVVAVQTLPGMLDVYLFSRSNMDIGERSAVTTITRHLLVIAGVVAVAASLGLSWDNMQWLVAAMGVGLGFGLQEIVANLFSGLLLLFEQRIRLRDFVTVGETTGHVTAIRTLSTTVTDRQNRELVIPNKEFITGHLINWTLSDRTVRLRIPVGIAYGSDTRKAEEILVRVGGENEFALDDPPAQALFTGFGANSLDFELQVWLPNVEHLWDVRHELHRAVDDAFREAGITIAFPQLDVHLDSPRECVLPSGHPPAEADGQTREMEAELHPSP